MYIYTPTIVEQTTENIQETQGRINVYLCPILKPETPNNNLVSNGHCHSQSLSSTDTYQLLKLGDKGWHLHPVQNSSTQYKLFS